MGADGFDREGPGRSAALLSRAQRFERKAGLLARLVAPGFHRILDRLDVGLESGSITGRLPDGTVRLLGGRRPGFDAEVELRDWRALIRLASNGSIGWYQGWANGEWTSPDPVQVFAVFGANAASLGSLGRASGLFRLSARLGHWLNRNDRAGARRNIEAHYDLGNAFYSAWLDPTMSYSSGYAVEGSELEEAQRKKWDLLEARLGDAKKVLEIGCGWGGFAAHLAEGGREITAISLSDEQLEWARARHGAAGKKAGGSVDFLKQDYRDVNGQFDGIVSVEMVEALGREYWPEFMRCLARNLEHGGRAAIQFISMRDDIFEAYAASADFIQAYVFPGGMLIKKSEFRALAEKSGLRWADQSNFGQDYAETLRLWRKRFEEAVEREALPQEYDARFIDMWRYYLMYCEGGFRCGNIDVHQVTLIKS